nr:transposase [Micromonospora halophytica]
MRVPKPAQPWIATWSAQSSTSPTPTASEPSSSGSSPGIEAKFPAPAEHLDHARRDDLLAFTGALRKTWRQIWSNNPQKPLNKVLHGPMKLEHARPLPHRDLVVVVSYTASADVTTFGGVPRACRGPGRH